MDMHQGQHRDITQELLDAVADKARDIAHKYVPAEWLQYECRTKFRGSVLPATALRSTSGRLSRISDINVSINKKEKYE